MLQAQALSTGKVKDEGTWETVWVNDNGSQITLDEEADVPDDLDEADYTFAKV